MPRKSIVAAVAGLCAAAAVAAADLGGLWPWASQNPAKPAPVKPYEIPTFEGQARDFRQPAPALAQAPAIDGDAVFRAVVDCYPVKSRWKMDVDLEAAVRSSRVIDVTGTAIGRSNVGIVARMPIYSATEHDREMEREARRRADTAKTVADFVEKLAERNASVRAVALYSALEQRARVRVNTGIADALEQVGYMEKTSTAERDLIRAEAGVMQTRLQLVAMCREGEADQMNRFLSGLAQLPAAR